MPFITIFTATYNRAYTLPRLYKSLCRQTMKDFVWLVVDDGSADETEELIAGWAEEQHEFEIKYIKQENSGKMQAVNKGVSLADSKMLFVVDSDDYLPENAVERIFYWEGTISGKDGFAGVAGCKYHLDGSLTGTSFEGEYIDATSLERRSLNINGDKAEVFYTDIIKQYPFPRFEGEKFVPEAVVFNRIASDGYRFRWVNENFYFCEYLQDGYSKNVNANLIRNWQGYSLYVKELMKSKASLKEKIIPLCGYIYRYVLKVFGSK